MSKTSLFALLVFYAAVLSLYLGLAVGWVINLVWLVTGAAETSTDFWIALIGTIVFPLGAAHGWYTLI